MQYQVDCLAVSGKGNRIYTPEDGVIDGSKFENVDELVKSGKLKRVGKNVVIEKVDDEKPNQTKEVFKKASDEETEKKSYEDITVKELREITGITDPKKRKADLYKVYSDLA